MNRESELVNEKLVKRVQETFSKAQILIITPNKTSRNNLKRIFTSFGFPLSDIAVVDDFPTAAKTIEKFNPQIVVSSLFYEDDKTANDLFNIHKQVFPNRVKTIFSIISDVDKYYIETYKHHYNFDLQLSGTQNFQYYLDKFSALFEKKTKPTKACLLEYKINEELQKSAFQKVFTYLKAADEVSFPEHKEFFYLAEAQVLNNEIEQACEAYKIAAGMNSNCYTSLIKTIEYTFELEEYDHCHEYILLFLENYRPLPSHLPIFLKVLLAHKEYNRVYKLSLNYFDDDFLSNEIKMNIAASLTHAGKSLLKSKPNLAKDCLTSALVISGGQSLNILNLVIDSLLNEIEDYELANKFVDKYRLSFADNQQFKALEFSVHCKTKSHNELLDEGMTLLKKGIKSFKIYEEVIKSSIEFGRRNEVIEDLIFEASKSFPEYKSDFESLLKN